MKIEKINLHESGLTVKQYLHNLQNRICAALEHEDNSAKFQEEEWEYENGTGGGITRYLENGEVIEKAGVNFSHVKGMQLPASATQKRPELKDCNFEAMGVSVIVHPRNPYVPTSHMNVRFIIAEKPNADPIWWFGGGFDLTPYYGFEEDCQSWHETARQACEPFGSDIYPKYKKWCDEYFYLKHRNEPRGIGGLFFDDFNQLGFEESFAFMRSIGDHYIKAYQPIMEKRKSLTYGEREKEFQTYRRGRYVEFNLLYDRGTLFGLQSGGRTESILMSLPPQVSWKYKWTPETGSEEERLYKEFLVTKDWI